MADVGERVRRLREQRGMTQVELAAGLPVSGSYISLIEAGKRAPRARVLDLLAERLGCTVDYLLTGRGGDETRDLDLDLRFAELALRSGDAAVARERFEHVRALADHVSYHDASHAARWGIARALEMLGELPAALRVLESLAAVDDLPRAVNRTAVLNTMCRVLHRLGDSTRAVEVGEDALRMLRLNEDLDDDEASDLAATLVFCYYDRGDLALAEITVTDLIDRAERIGSPRARAAAYWNAGIVAEARGDLSTAKAYAERALALYSESDNERRLAMIQVDCAWVLLRQANPDHERARELLERALPVLTAIGAPAVVGGVEVELARCHLFAGEPQAAITIAERGLARLSTDQALEQARGHALIAYAEAALDDPDAAVRAYAAALGALEQAEPSRHVAAVRRELAELMLALERPAEAMAAYQAVADTAGVPKPSLTLERIASVAAARPRQLS
jgi:transcriptional regulator with XRE-family HTH domain